MSGLSLIGREADNGISNAEEAMYNVSKMNRMEKGW
jgi:hypothetical protein